MMYLYGRSSSQTAALTLVSRHVAVLCLTAPTFVGRESGVCDTNIPHCNAFVVMVITDGCLRGACYIKSRGARTIVQNDDCQPGRSPVATGEWRRAQAEDTAGSV